MFASLAASIRRLPVWGQALAWPLYGLARTFVWVVEWLASLITRSAAGFFGVMVRGSLLTVLAKVAAVILCLGLLVAALDAQEAAAALITLSAVPIMLIGLAFMVKGAFAPPKKKKKRA